MRSLIAILLLLHFCPSSLAAITSTSVAPSSLNPASSPERTLSSNTFPAFHRPTPSSSLRLPSIAARPPGRGQVPGHIIHSIRPTHTGVVAPSAIDGPRHREQHPSSQKPILIFFEILGGLAALAVLISCLRCCYIYNRTPKRDRIAAVLHRHQLERELEELERNHLALRRSATNDPVPPYFPPPPTYEATTSTSTTIAPQRSGYVEISTTSPPSSPPLPTRELGNGPPPTISRTFIPPSIPIG